MVFDISCFKLGVWLQSWVAKFVVHTVAFLTKMWTVKKLRKTINQVSDVCNESSPKLFASYDRSADELSISISMFCLKINLTTIWLVLRLLKISEYHCYNQLFGSVLFSVTIETQFSSWDHSDHNFLIQPHCLKLVILIVDYVRTSFLAERWHTASISSDHCLISAHRQIFE